MSYMRHTVALTVGGWSTQDLINQGCARLSQILSTEVSPNDVAVEYLHGIDRPEMLVSVEVNLVKPIANAPRKLDIRRPMGDYVARQLNDHRDPAYLRPKRDGE